MSSASYTLAWLWLTSPFPASSSQIANRLDCTASLGPALRMFCNHAPSTRLKGAIWNSRSFTTLSETRPMGNCRLTPRSSGKPRSPLSNQCGRYMVATYPS